MDNDPLAKQEIARCLAPAAWAALGKQNDSPKHRDRRVASLAIAEAGGEWLTIECEVALYVDRGRTVVLCDRLPRPVTLVIKRSAQTPEQPNGND